jgi:hypothetical protein
VAALEAVRDLKLPDCYIAAGAIRNCIWNHFHKFPATFHQTDVDVVYFDLSDMDGEKEKPLEEILSKKLPNLKWEVVNQARGHLFEHGQEARPPVSSSCESIAYWSETPTCIGVRLEDDDSFTICAPHGLDDLLNLVVKPVPQPYQNLSFYRERIIEKNWDKFWPKLKIVRP